MIAAHEEPSGPALQEDAAPGSDSCPCCGAFGLSYGDLDFDSDSIFQSWSCDCGASGWDTYALEGRHVEHEKHPGWLRQITVEVGDDEQRRKDEITLLLMLSRDDDDADTRRGMLSRDERETLQRLADRLGGK